MLKICLLLLTCVGFHWRQTCVCAALILARPAPKPKGWEVDAIQDLCARTIKQRAWKQTIDGVVYTTAGYATDLGQPQAQMLPMKNVVYQERVRGKDGLMHWATRSRMETDTSKPSRPNPEFANWKKPQVVTFPLTVVLTTNALLGQWQDELTKFAPSLRVRWYYGIQKHKIYADLQNTDVILSTHGTSLFSEGDYDNFIRVHRLIIDECHGRDAIGNAVTSLRGPQCAWGVTGTPLSSSVNDLKKMAQLLGHWHGGLQLEQYAVDNALRPQLADVLKQLMIRHTKSQRIGGLAALALPEAASETVWVEMSPSERSIYRTSLTSGDNLANLIAEPDRAKTFTVENAIVKRRQACCGAGVLPRFLSATSWLRKNAPVHAPTGIKLKVLLSDLEQLRTVEPSLHAVVFTHHVDAYEKICKALWKAGFVVCGFSGSVVAAERHRTIRDFQASAEASVAKGAKRVKVPPKVFVATMKVGNVGMTLTAATRVYLMEPCLDPSMELQAAGRIHRLGQTKAVLVKKLCYKNSIDSAVVELHKKISNGALSIVDNTFPVEALRILQMDQ